LNTQFSSAPVTDHGVTITNVGGESCGTCGLGQALKQSLNTSYYRMTLSLLGGPQSIADVAHQAGIPTAIPGVPGRSLTENGGPPLPGIVLGQYSVRPIDMASAYATLAASGTYHAPHFVQKVLDATGAVLLDNGAGHREQRIARYLADGVTTAMAPIAGYSNHHELSGPRPSAAKTGTTQLGNTGLNKDAWMIGYTPSLSTAVWIGTEHSTAIRTRGGSSVYGAGLPADIWRTTMDDALAGTPIDKFAPADTGGGLFVSEPPRSTPAPPAVVATNAPLFAPGPSAVNRAPEPDPILGPR